MKTRRRYYSRSFKQKVVTEYIETDISQRELRMKYDIRAVHSIQRWYNDFKSSKSEFKAESPTLDEMKSKKERELLKRIAELERALENAELTSVAYQKLVENAEKELGFSLPKKSSTKQSKS